MFGYVVANEQELRIREFHLYRSYYCGLCKDLGEYYGQPSRLTLSYDTTFLALLLTSLYEPKDSFAKTRCIAHPFERHPTRRNEYTRYAADINILLSYYACMDDWQDERNFKKRAMALILSGANQKASQKRREKAEKIVGCLTALHEVETNAAASGADLPDGASGAPLSGAALLDKAGGIFGDLMAEVFDVHGDLWREPLRRMGFYLGKFIYILDAYDDLDKDAESGSFNPLMYMKDREDLDNYVRDILQMMMAECSAAFEALPIVENVEILRNILYCGIWSGFEKRFRERNQISDSMKEVSDNE